MDPFSVCEIIQFQNDKVLTFDKKIEIKERKRPVPIFVFRGKRQCRLSELYQKNDWICGSAELQALFCFPCLIFKFKQTVWASTGVIDLGNLTNLIKAHIKTDAHLSFCLSLTLLGKVRI